jgi:hypothetical protein
LSVVQLNAPLHERCIELEAEIRAVGFDESSRLDYPLEKMPSEDLESYITIMEHIICERKAGRL